MGAVAIVWQSCWQSDLRLGPSALVDMVERGPAVGDTASAVARVAVRRLGYGLGNGKCHGLAVCSRVGAAGSTHLRCESMGIYKTTAGADSLCCFCGRDDVGVGEPPQLSNRSFGLRASDWHSSIFITYLVVKSRFCENIKILL